MVPYNPITAITFVKFLKFSILKILEIKFSKSYLKIFQTLRIWKFQWMVSAEIDHSIRLFDDLAR